MTLYYDGRNYYLKELEQNSAFYGSEKSPKPENRNDKPSEKAADKAVPEKIKQDKRKKK